MQDLLSIRQDSVFCWWIHIWASPDYPSVSPWAETWRRVWWDGTKFRGPTFWM